MTKDEIRTREDFINLYALHLGLDRFIEAQDKWNTYQTALEEVKAGKKRTHWNEKSVYEIFGNDVIKVRSCMLLFASVSDIPIFQKMLEKHCWR